MFPLSKRHLDFLRGSQARWKIGHFKNLFYWLFGLVAWFSLRVREALGSLPRTALLQLPSRTQSFPTRDNDTELWQPASIGGFFCGWIFPDEACKTYLGHARKCTNMGANMICWNIKMALQVFMVSWCKVLTISKVKEINILNTPNPRHPTHRDGCLWDVLQGKTIVHYPLWIPECGGWLGEKINRSTNSFIARFTLPGQNVYFLMGFEPTDMCKTQYQMVNKPRFLHQIKLYHYSISRNEHDSKVFHPDPKVLSWSIETIERCAGNKCIPTRRNEYLLKASEKSGGTEQTSSAGCRLVAEPNVTKNFTYLKWRGFLYLMFLRILELVFPYMST